MPDWNLGKYFQALGNFICGFNIKKGPQSAGLYEIFQILFESNERLNFFSLY